MSNGGETSVSIKDRLKRRVGEIKEKVNSKSKGLREMFGTGSGEEKLISLTVEQRSFSWKLGAFSGVLRM